VHMSELMKDVNWSNKYIQHCGRS